MYLLRFNQTLFKIYKRVGGVWTEIGSQSSVFPRGNTNYYPYIGDRVGLKVVGNQIMGTINGNVVLTVTDNDISAAGRAGVGIGYVNISTDDSGTGVCFDDFNVESINSNYTLSYFAGLNGTLSGETNQSVPSGEDGSSVTAIPNKGYHFVNWSDSSTDNPRIDTNVTANISVTANFSANTYQVAFNGNGADSGSMDNQNFTYNTAQNLTANQYTRTGYTFSGWNTASDGSGTSYDDEENVSNLTATNGAIVTLYAQWADAQNPVISNISVSPSSSQATI